MSSRARWPRELGGRLEPVDMSTKKQTKAVAKESSRSFSGIVGADTYKVWVRMLSKLVP